MKIREVFSNKLLSVIYISILLGVIFGPTNSTSAAVDPPFEVPTLTTADPIDNLIKVALSQEGYQEAADGTAFYSEWLNQSGRAWCSEFVAWCAYKAGIPTDVIPSGTSVKKYRNFFSDRDEFYVVEGGACDGCECHLYTTKTISINDIKPGDIAFIETNEDNATGDDHTALVMSVSEGYIYTIEGNTSDQVKQKQRAISRVHGICRPDYSKVTYSDIKLKKTKLLSVITSNKDTLKWKTVSGVEGYQIFRAASKNGNYKLVKTINSAKKSSCSISNSSNKKYYYRIATINTYRDVVYLSEYSNIVSNR